MKRVLMFMSAVIMASVFKFTVSASQPAKVTIISDKQSYSVNDVVKVTMKINNVSDLYGIELKLNYNKDYFTYKDGSANSAVVATLGTKVNDGKISYVGTKVGNTPGANGDVSLATMQFVANKEGSAAFELESIAVSDSKGNLLNTDKGPALTVDISKVAPQNSGVATTLPSEDNKNQTKAPSTSTSSQNAKGTTKPEKEQKSTSSNTTNINTTNTEVNTSSNMESKTAEVASPETSNTATANSDQTKDSKASEEPTVQKRSITRYIILTEVVIILGAGAYAAVLNRKKKLNQSA